MTSPNLIILYVKDPGESASFYRDLLNREPAVEAPNFVAFPLEGGFTLGLWRRSKVEPQPSAIGNRGEVAFMVEGENAVASTTKTGASVVCRSPRTDRTGFWSDLRRARSGRASAACL